MNDTVLEFDNRLDIDFLNSLYENDKEYAAIVFEQFLLKFPEQIEEIESSFKAEDAGLLKLKIHKMKPTFSFVGLTGLTAKAELIEKNCAAASEWSLINDLYADFKKEVDEYIPIVEAEFEKLKA